jgi:hypothetical protein
METEDQQPQETPATPETRQADQGSDFTYRKFHARPGRFSIRIRQGRRQRPRRRDRRAASVAGASLRAGPPRMT